MRHFILLFFLLAFTACTQEEQYELPILQKAIIEGNYQLIKEKLEGGADANITFRGFPALFFAVSLQCNLKIVSVFLEHGADVNAREPVGEVTPILSALDYGNMACIEVLLDYGADITHNDINSKHAIHYSVQSGNLEVVKKVMSLGLDPNITHAQGGTALMYAASAGYSDIAEYLLTQGAIECIRDEFGRSPRDYAISGGVDDTIKLFTLECPK